jgi:ubiquinol-cytochrome c reductase cytochrome b subunit
VSNATLNRFYSLHFLLPFVLSALALMHLLTLHTNGSSNPLGVSTNGDKLPMHPYFIFKDLVTILAFIGALAAIVLYAPNLLGHSDNYIMANPYYAILRSVPNKLLGVVAMLASLLILLAMPLLDTGRVRGSQFRPLARVSFWALVSILGVLLFLGSQHAEEPYVTLGAIFTVLYFGWYLVLTPVVGLVENTLADLADQS